jgi:hypothetical protein
MRRSTRGFSERGSSFVWLVSEGMRLRPQHDALVFNLLNKGW